MVIPMLLTACTGGGSAQRSVRVVTSFYPVYVLTLNLTDGIEGLTVANMTQSRGGCLHDYQLLPGDMRLLSTAELFVINGAGLETFLDMITGQLPDLAVCDSSRGTTILSGEGEAHEHGAGEIHGHDHGDNAHIWLSIDNAMVQVQNISDALIEAFPQYRERLESNTADYLARLKSLQAEIHTLLAPYRGEQVVSFHEGFDYLMAEFGLSIAHEVETHDGAQPSAKELAHVTREVEAEGIRLLAIDADEPPVSAEVLARETGAVICPLYTIVSGDGDKYSYENAMRQNAQAVVEVLDA
ncbi:MAG: metal ABC transporter substrate-binding protein [Clostridia bacterium]